MASRAEEQREWRKRNPGKAAEYSKRYKEKNKDIVLASMENWRSNNKEYISEYNSRYTKENLDEIVTKKRNKRAERKGLEGFHTKEDIYRLIEDQSGLCNHCSEPLDAYDVDHIIPQSRGGSNWPSNLQILCPHCNRSKNAKTMEEWVEHQNRMKRIKASKYG